MIKTLQFKIAVILITFGVSSCEEKQLDESFLFNEFVWGGNVNSGVLCSGVPADPSDTNAVIFLDCAIEGDNLTDVAVPEKDDLLVFAYNIERGHSGDEIIQLLQSEAELNEPDVILLSEVDRGCPQSFGGRNFARVLADSLNMYYVYGNEFYEIGDHCEIGNAILSKYPMGNVEFMRFDSASTVYLFDGNGTNYRQGGRSCILADIKIGDKYLRVYSTHLAANILDQGIREGQTRQMTEHASGLTHPVIIGGDLNSISYSIGLWQNNPDQLGVAGILFDNGYSDTHSALPFQERITNVDIIDLVIDLFFVKQLEYSNPQVGNSSNWEGLSDHNPVWVTVHLP